MNERFDAYHKWLGIPAEEQPPDHYRLLGIRRFEDDPEVIDSAADQRMLHLRTFQTGRRAVDCQKLLNEVAAARVCLLNADQRTAYDAILRNDLPAADQPEAQAVVGTPVATALPAIVPDRPAIYIGGVPAISTGRVRSAARRPKPWVPIALGVGGVVVLMAFLWALATDGGAPPAPEPPARSARSPGSERPVRSAHSERPVRPSGASKENASSVAPAAGAATDRAAWPHAPAAKTPPTEYRRERVAATNPDPAGLQAHWRLDDGSGTTAADASGNGRAGTLAGWPTWSDDAPPLITVKGSLAFDGTADMVETPNDAALNPSGSFSVSAWVKVEGGAGTYRAVISSRDSLVIDEKSILRGYVVYAAGSDQWQIMLGDGAVWVDFSGDVPVNDRWTHVVLTFEQTGSDGEVLTGIGRLFVDGELAGTRTNARYLPQAENHPLRLGMGANETPTGRFHFNGKLADVRIYNRLLSAEEISAMCPWQTTWRH